jgi:hypothetical protein
MQLKPETLLTALERIVWSLDHGAIGHGDSWDWNVFPPCRRIVLFMFLFQSV